MPLFALAVSAAIAFTSAPVRAQAPAPQRPAAAEPELDAVTVTATRVEQRSFDAPAAVDALGAAVIRGQRAGVDLSESLGRAPGINVQNRHNYAQDLQVSSRGFGARASFGTRGVRLVQDGIPFTMPDGQGQTGLFDLDSARRIEVLRGPFAALYGNSAGGVLALLTDDPPLAPTVDWTMLAGSNGAWKLRAGAGATTGALGATASVSRFRTDGYRDHSSALRDLSTARFSWRRDDASSITLNATILDQPETRDPLGLTRDQLAQDRRQAGTGALQFDTRKSVDHRQLGLAYERRLGPQDTLRLRTYAGDRRVVQYLAFSGAATTSSGGVVDLDRGFAGASLQWTRSMRLADGPANLTLGLDHDTMTERRRGFVNDFGVAGAPRRNESNSVDNLDPYLIGEWWFAPRWKLAGGVRHSRVSFDVRDDFVNASNPDDSGGRRYSATSPVAGLLYALSDRVNLFVSAGRGFETPTFAELAYRPDGQAGLNFALNASRSSSVETGVKALIGDSARANLTVFVIDTRDDIVPDRNVAGRATFRNAARTLRRGVELGFDAALGAGFRAALAYTWLSAEFRDYRGLAGNDLSGNALPGVPAQSLYAELAWLHPKSGFRSALEIRRNARVYVDDANTDHAGAYAVLNLRAGFDWRAGGWRISPFIRIDNLLDSKYVGSVIVNAANGRYYEPAPTRAVLAGISASLAF